MSKRDSPPIYAFEGLKRLLSSLGYQVDTSEAYHEIENKDVDINDFRSNIEFTNNGIFFKDKNGRSKQQIFLYKRKYHLQVYGKPRFHIRYCPTIQSFINSGTFKTEYRRANTEQVKVYDMDFDEEQVISDLPLCKFCARIANANNINNSTTFVKLIKQVSNRDEAEVDIFGYTKNWEYISQSYRESKDYTCERCGIKIDGVYKKIYTHVHHKDFDKTNNDESNLECLCIRCHARVDEFHRKRFAEGANKTQLEQFNRLYPEK